MTSKLTRSLTVSFAIAAALAMPTAVKAQSSNVATAAFAGGVSADKLDAEYSDSDIWDCYNQGGFWVPGYGCLYP